MGHFSLDVDPDALDAAGSGLVELGTHLAERAAEARNTPGQISAAEWSGAAHAAITAEMTALGGQLTRFGPMVTAAGQALKKVAAEARTAQDVTLRSLNARWDAAQQTYRDAVSKADSAYRNEAPAPNRGAGATGSPPGAAPPSAAPPGAVATVPDVKELQDRRDRKVDAAQGVRGSAEGQLNREFTTLVTELEAAFTAASTVLSDSTVVAVPDATVAGFVSGGGTGAIATWSSPEGLPFPPELGARVLLGKELHLYDGKRALDDAARADDLRTRIMDPERIPAPAEVAEFNRLLEQNKGGKTFSTELMNRLGPRGLLEFTGRIATLSLDDPAAQRTQFWTPDVARTLGVVQANLGIALATATAQPDGPDQVPRQWLTDLAAAGRQKIRIGGSNSAVGGPLEVHGYQLLGVLLNRGTYGAEFLDTVGGDMVAFEREHGKGVGQDASHVWTDMRPRGIFASTRLNWIDGWESAAQAGYDPVVGLMTALKGNPDGARAFFTGGERDGRLLRVDYLLTDRTWPKDLMTTPDDFQQQHVDPSVKNYASAGLDTLGHALEAATTKDPDQRSVRIVESLVREVSIDEQAKGFPNGPAEGNKALEFKDVDLIPPSVRDSMGRIMAAWIPSVHASIASGGDGPPRAADGDRDPFLPGVQTLAATFDQTELMRFLAELGKDEGARRDVVDAEVRYTAIGYDMALRDGVDQAALAKLKYISAGAGQVFGALDFGANAAGHATMKAADSAANKGVADGVTGAFFAAALIKDVLDGKTSLIRAFPAGTVTFFALREIWLAEEKERKHDHTGAANYEAGLRIGNGEQLISRLVSESIYRNTAPADLPPGLRDPATGAPVPMDRWTVKERGLWEDYAINLEHRNGGLIAGERSNAVDEYRLGYEDAENRLQQWNAPP